MSITYWTNSNNEEQVIITNEDGSQIVMFKYIYDEQQKALKDAAN